MAHIKQFSSVLPFAAVLSMIATPVAAADLPVPAVQSAAPSQTVMASAVKWDSDALNAEHGYRYRGYGHHHRRTSVGDVIAGAIIIGGIAAIASSASRNNRNRNYRNNAPVSSSGGQGLDRAANMCVQEIERNARVQAVNNVVRTSAGWNVNGSLYNGEGFNCQIDNNGRVGNIYYSERSGQYQPSSYQSGPVEDRQYDDASYSAAWGNVTNGAQQQNNQGYYYSEDGFGG